VNEEKTRTYLHEVLDKQSVLANQEKQRLRTAMYASDFSSCLRKCWFQFFPEQYPSDGLIDARTARIFENGNAVHTRLGGYLKREEGLDFHDELDVPRDELEVHGRCDGICRVNEQAIVVEFKSINKDEMGEPKSEHIGQVLWYIGMMRILRQDLREDFGLVEGEMVDEDDLKFESASGRTWETMSVMERWLLTTQGEIKGEIIYESKGTQEITAFSVEFNESSFKEIRLWFEQLKWHVENKEMPRVNYYPSKFPCSWGSEFKKNSGKCQFYGRCWGGKTT